MDREIGTAVEVGPLSEIDGDALETASDAIGNALAYSTGASMSRIDSLIEDRATAGTLTQDQAAALQSFFAQRPGGSNATTDASNEAQGLGIDAMAGVGGPGAMRGPRPGPPPSGASDESSTIGSTDATSAL